jgi:3-oxoacyl-[acyl-carrier protein] reductase
VEPDPLGEPAHDQGDVRAAEGLPLPVHGSRPELRRLRHERRRRPAVAVAVVTGLSRRGGIAAAVALALARDGWDLLATGWPAHDAAEPWGARPGEAAAVADEARQAGVRVALREDDLADPAVARAVFDAAEAELGAVNALVAVHAHSEMGGLLETDAAQLRRHLAVNAEATALLCAELARRFRGEHGSGRVVAYTSGPPLLGELAYAASKGALEWIVLSAAAELAPRGITVNAIDPGPTDTGWMSEELRDRLRASSPLGRLGRPEDSAALVAFLLSPGGGWITGQILRCDGGWSSVRTSRRAREPR